MEEQNFTTLHGVHQRHARSREDDEEFQNPVDLLFDATGEAEKPNHFAVTPVQANIKLAAGDICSK